jgi:hypothetical protein
MTASRILVLPVVTHFEIWAASQISVIMDQSHRIWQSNDSAAHVAGSWNRRVGTAWPGCPRCKQVARGRSYLFSLFFVVKYQPNQ